MPIFSLNKLRKQNFIIIFRASAVW